MNVLLLLLGLSPAAALDPPTRPAAPKAVDGECKKVIPLARGQSPSTDLLHRDGVVACSAVAVPLSQYADLLNAEIWAEQLDARYRIDTAHLEWQIGWYQGELEQAREPIPVLSRPITHVVVGLVGGIGIVLTTAYALQAVED